MQSMQAPEKVGKGGANEIELAVVIGYLMVGAGEFGKKKNGKNGGGIGGAMQMVWL